MGLLLDYAQDLIVLLDSSGRFRYANDAVGRNLGWDPDSVIGDVAFEYVHPDDVEAVTEAFGQTIEADSFTETTVEHRFRAADGSWRCLRSRMSNLTDERLDGYVVSARDITDRVEAQRERERTASRLHEISSTTGDVLWMFSGDWSELLFVNPAYEDVYGGNLDALERDPQAFLETIHPEDVPSVLEGMERLSEGQPVDMEYRVNPDRDYGIWVWVQAEPILEDGKVARIAGFARDVTDRHRRHRQLRVMDNLLRHNLRNDLNVVRGHIELLERDETEVADSAAVIRKTVDDLLASAEKQRDLIKYLTEETTRCRTDVLTAVERAADRIRERYPDASVQVEMAVPGDRPEANALSEVDLVVTELIENAVSHADGDEPHAQVTVSTVNGWVVVTVEDEGAPIPEFEASVLTGDHEMSEIYHSTGLGLWLVYWVVELSGGWADVQSRPDGNRVQVGFPRYTDEDGDEDVDVDVETEAESASASDSESNPDADSNPSADEGSAD